MGGHRRRQGLVVLWFSVSSAMVMMVLPSVLGSSGVWVCSETMITPGHYFQGMKATFNTVNSTFTSATDSSVSFSITLRFPSNNWIQMGYVKGYIWPNSRAGGPILLSTPTVYVEEGGFDRNGAPYSVKYTFASLEIETAHTFDIHWTGIASDGRNTWCCYLDGIPQRTSFTSSSDCHPVDVLAQGECHDSQDSSPTVYFESMYVGHWVYPHRGRPVFQWIGFTCNTTPLHEGDWHITPGTSSFSLWLI